MNRVMELAEILWNYHRMHQLIEPSDCILGLGSYDIRVAHRCADLWKEHLAPFIIFSGSDGNWTRGLWNKTEAEIFADEAIACEVPEGKIYKESNATNIGENIRYTREVLESKGISASKIIVVTKPNTERRAFATAKKNWPEANFMVTSPFLTLHSPPAPGRTIDDLINEMVGDLQRIKKYPEVGYQIYQEIPDSVWTAYEELISLGYNHHLMK